MKEKILAGTPGSTGRAGLCQGLIVCRVAFKQGPGRQGHQSPQGRGSLGVPLPGWKEEKRPGSATVSPGALALARPPASPASPWSSAGHSSRATSRKRLFWPHVPEPYCLHSTYHKLTSLMCLHTHCLPATHPPPSRQRPCSGGSLRTSGTSASCHLVGAQDLFVK